MTEEQFVEFIKYFQEHNTKFSFGLADLSEKNKMKDFCRISPDKISHKILTNRKGALCVVLDKSILRTSIDSKELKKMKPSISNYIKLIKKGKDVLGDVEYIRQLESGFNEFITAWNTFICTLNNEI